MPDLYGCENQRMKFSSGREVPFEFAVLLEFWRVLRGCYSASSFGLMVPQLVSSTHVLPLPQENAICRTLLDPFIRSYY